MQKRFMMLIGIILMLIIGLTSAQTSLTTNSRSHSTEVCENQEPQGRQIGNRDQTRGENPPRDGRGVQRGEGRRRNQNRSDEYQNRNRNRRSYQRFRNRNNDRQRNYNRNRESRNRNY